MKKLLLILLFSPMLGFGGNIYKILADTTFIGSIPYRTTAGELLLFNTTRDTTQSVLYNTGNGITEFKKVRLIRQNDSTYVFKIGTVVIGDTIKIRSTGGSGSGGTVTDFIFTDGGGFDGTVTNSTTTPTLSIVADSVFKFASVKRVLDSITALRNIRKVDSIYKKSTNRDLTYFKINGTEYSFNDSIGVGENISNADLTADGDHTLTLNANQLEITGSDSMEYIITKNFLGSGFSYFGLLKANADFSTYISHGYDNFNGPHLAQEMGTGGNSTGHGTYFNKSFMFWWNEAQHTANSDNANTVTLDSNGTTINSKSTGVYNTLWNYHNGASLDNIMKLGNNGSLQLHNYGGGTFSGTPTYGLSVDVNGNIIETTPQTLSRTFADSISLSISGGNTVKLPYAVDSVGATSDSIIVYKFGIRKSYTNGSSGGASLSGLTAATATNTINNTNYKQRWSWNTIGADTALVLNSTSTQANSNLQTVLAVAQSGANANSTQSTFGIKISNVKTGTSATNVGLDIVCSGGSVNNAINIQSGRLQMNTNSIYFTNNSNIGEVASSLGINSQRVDIGTSLGSAGQAFGINSGGAYQFSVGMYSSYYAPYMALGGAVWNGGTTFYSYGTNSIIFKDVAGDLALMQDAGLTYATTFTPTERVRFKVDGSIGVGTSSPNASAIMDLTSTTRGFLPPRMTTTQRDAISTPAAGLIIYNTTTNKLNVFTTTWEVITSL